MIQLRNLDTADINAAEALYLASFPPEERRPWEQIADADTEPQAYGIYDADNLFAGFITVWNFGGYVYVEHFAVDSTRRGSGIGAAAMASLRELAGVPVVLEVEPPGHPDPMVPRRIAFYKRCGFALLDYDYVQPPYAPGLPSVPLCLMSTDSAIEASEIERTLHTKVYGQGG